MPQPSLPQEYVRYGEDVERKADDEDQTFEKLIRTFGELNRKLADRYRHAVKPSHAKSHALLKGQLRVLGDLPDELAQGLFAQPRTYPVVIRVASVPGDLLADRVHTQRGMAFKVIGVAGEMLARHEGQVTQDFLLDNDTKFPVPDAKSFVPVIEALAAGATHAEALKAATSSVSRAANAVLHAVGMDSANLDFFGHPPVHPLADRYYSQAPLRYGDYVAKIGVAPVSDNLLALADEEIDISDGFSPLKEAIGVFLRTNQAEYELRVQLCTDLEKMPVEDASVDWPQQDSPYRPVARIEIGPQEPYSSERRVYGDDVLSFSPAHGLAAHRPLGSIMRARLKAYAPSSRFRHQTNVQPRTEPTSMDQIPD